jgi:hypothetical protein
MPCSLYGFRELSLMYRAYSAYTAGEYLSPFRNKMGKQLAVLIVDVGNFFSAKLAHPLAPYGKAFWTSHGINSLSIKIESLKPIVPQAESDPSQGQIATQPPAAAEICADVSPLFFQRASDLHPFVPR